MSFWPTTPADDNYDLSKLRVPPREPKTPTRPPQAPKPPKETPNAKPKP